jgi:hypothetical protein
MPKTTLQQRLVNALVATGRGIIVQSRSRKYVTLERLDQSFFYAGRNGALRFGKTISNSMAAPEDFKRRLLEETSDRKFTTMDAAGRSARRSSSPLPGSGTPRTVFAARTNVSARSR